MRPNLFIVGAPKCGTTAWVEYLSSHPDIFFSEIKEPHFFAYDLPRMRWTDSVAKYETLFDRAGDAKIIGEGSVWYLYSTTAAEAIRKYNPDARILIFLRPQEDFLPSLHQQHLFRMTEPVEDFGDAWRMADNRPPELIPKIIREPKLLDYRTIGKFSEQVERYYANFPAEQIRLVRFNEWTVDPRATYLQLLDFLGLEDDGRTEFPRINEAKGHRSKLIGRLVLYPPWFLERPVQLLRKLTGRKRMGLAETAVKLVTSAGYRNSVPTELRDEIRDYYKEDNEALARLTKPKARVS